MSEQKPHCISCGAPLGDGLLTEICPACVMKNMEDTVDHHELCQTTTDWSDEKKTHAASSIKEGDAFGPYQIKSKLGQGGMGIVYEAIHHETSRRIALKVLARGLHSTEEQTRFFQEGRLAASINSPNSVYVYSTGTIENLPVISMELVQGQTLQEKVMNQGSLSISEAVDAIMDVITGLKAAEKKGILHRDIKPSNCFEDFDGHVKVGDFGLSISTEGAPQTGDGSDTFMGTPAFASPEQIRCQKLSIQSDLYSVGMTLYFLLTGKTAFTGKNIAQHMDNVLNHEPIAPLEISPDLPSKLNDIILKCLEKVPSNRFKNYEELQEHLKPFVSSTPLPAYPLQRSLAGVLDWMIPSILGALIMMLPLLTFPWYTIVLINLTGVALNFILLEGLSGASCGKYLMGLKVIDLKGKPPGLWKSFIRFLPFSLGNLIMTYTQHMPSHSETGDSIQVIISFISIVLTYSIFITMKKKNAYQALHDRWSGTKVISSSKFQIRPLTPNPLETVDNETTKTGKIGDYHIIKILEEQGDEKWVLAYDAYLNRSVWIHKLADGAPVLEINLCQLRRPERLRWIGGRRNNGENWDVFEALDGQALLNLIKNPQPWDIVRFWLHDMIKELKASKLDDTRPKVLALDRIWITSEGKAKLLDFPAPGLKDEMGGQIKESAKIFLKALAYHSLEGKLNRDNQETLNARIPLRARNFLENDEGLTKFKQSLPLSKEWTKRPCNISRRPRVIAMAIWVLIPLITFVSTHFTCQVITESLEKHPEVLELNSVLTKREVNEILKDINSDDPALKDKMKSNAYSWVINDRFFSIYLSGNYKEILNNKELRNSFIFTTLINGKDLAFLEQSMEMYPNPSPEEINEAAIALFGPDKKDNTLFIETFKSSFDLIFSIFIFSWIPLVGLLPSLIVTLAGRTSVILSVMDIQLVNHKGQCASRLRVLLRWFIFWLHFSLCAGAVTYLIMVYHNLGFFIAILVLAIMAILNLWNPNRDLWDRWSGIWLVPKA